MSNVYKDLAKGDILLYPPLRSQLLGKLIAFFSGGFFCHSSLYIGNGEIIESHIDTGVVQKVLNPKWLPVITKASYYKPVSNKKIDEIIKWHKSKIGCKYEARTLFRVWLGIVFTWTGLRRYKQLFNNPNRFWCTELNDTGYAIEGIDISPNIHCTKATPADLGHSKVLIRTKLL